MNDSDLAIASAPDISVTATSAAGAVVTFAVPAATDEGGETPAVACDPASGETFPIGTTAVTCTATDSDDTPSSVQTTFQVTVSPAPTTTTLSSAPDPSPVGTAVTYTATVSPALGTGTPTGAVAFTDGGTPIAGCGSVTVSSTGTATCAVTYNAVGSHTITGTYTPANDSNFAASSGSLAQAVTYPFTGFLAPVANPSTVNMVTAGQAIPIQFSLGGNFGLGIIAAGYPTVQQVSCATGAPVNTSTETDTAGNSGLQYNATTNTYTYVWKTSKASKGTCQIFTLGLNDGTVHTANFQYVN